MEILWNRLTLDRPPTATWDSTSNNFPATSFLKLLQKIYNELNSQDILNKEAALLSRLIYRMKRKFRHDKGLKNVEKVNRALLNYLRISLENEYKYLINNTIINGNCTKLPTKQMLQYVLTRTQGTCMLLCRIEKVSAEAARFFKTRIEMGHAWTISFLAYSLISRIWLLSRHTVKRFCVWYNQIFPFLSQLNQIGVNWLPEHYQLPTDLKNWLSISWIDEPIEHLFTNENSVETIFKLIEHQNESDDETDQTAEKETNKYEETAITAKINEDLLQVNNDIGVPISRDSLAIDLKKSPKTSKTKNKVLKKMTENDLQQLLTLDSYPGLDKLQWRMIKKIMNKNLLKIRKSTNAKKRDIILKTMHQILNSYIDK